MGYTRIEATAVIKIKKLESMREREEKGRSLRGEKGEECLFLITANLVGGGTSRQCSSHKQC
jgi:hypothetical protein